MDSESVRYLFDSLSKQIHTTRGELKEDIQGVRYDLSRFIDKQEKRGMAQVLEMDRRKKFENKLLGAFGFFLIIIQIGVAFLPIFFK